MKELSVPGAALCTCVSETIAWLVFGEVVFRMSSAVLQRWEAFRDQGPHIFAFIENYSVMTWCSWIRLNNLSFFSFILMVGLLALG